MGIARLKHLRPDGDVWPPTAVGSIVMAIGIFVGAALQRIPWAGAHLRGLLAVALGIVWLVLVLLLLASLGKRAPHAAHSRF
jgi:hypothetical protein